MSDDWDADQYEAELARGLRLSGESAEHLAARRVQYVRAICEHHGIRPSLIVEFGCGTGNNLEQLGTAFPEARLVGLDTSAAMLEVARGRLGLEPELVAPDDFRCEGEADLVFVNGVFHHIDPGERLEALHRLRGYLDARGLLALFENNPANPGAMAVMRRIPFDRHAQPVTGRALRKLLAESGFSHVERRDYFYFPRVLAFLRWAEPLLTQLPLGAQYALYARGGT